MAAFHQTAALCRWNLSSLGGRFRNALIVVIGFFAVVLVFASVLSVRDGILRSETRFGSDRVVMVTRQHGDMDASMVSMIAQAPGVARKNGEPLVSGTTFTALLIRNWKPDQLGIATVLALDTTKADILPNFHIIQGRMPRSGLNEMLMGEGALRLYPEFAPGGRKVEWQHRQWTIVGVYSTGSVMRDSQFLTDLRQAQSAMRASSKFSGAYVRLVDASAFPKFKKWLETKPSLDASVQTMAEDDYEIGKQFRLIMTLADGIITALMAAGAVFAALNVMYANVASRSSELAVLRALGFSRLPVLAAILSEAMLLALVGGVLAVIVAVLCFDGFEARTLAGGWMVSFSFAVTPTAALISLALTLGMGFVGGLFPAIRAARLPIVAALREE